MREKRPESAPSPAAPAREEGHKYAEGTEARYQHEVYKRDIVIQTLAAQATRDAETIALHQEFWAKLCKLLNADGMDDPAFLYGMVEGEVAANDEFRAQILAITAQLAKMKRALEQAEMRAEQRAGDVLGLAAQLKALKKPKRRP